MPVQHTLRDVVEVSGVGLHSGEQVRVRLLPAECGHGVQFRAGGTMVPAHVDSVVDTRLATTLARDGARIATVEHLMAALAGLCVDNVVVDVDGPEVPALDGSAAIWIECIKAVGLAAQAGARRVFEVLRPVEVSLQGRTAKLSPAPRLELSAMIQFEHPLVGRQELDLIVENGTFEQELSWARTFGFLEHVDAMRRMGLVRGGSLHNAIVYGDDRVLNEGGLRRADEPVRHKMLDLYGDLALLGAPLRGRLEADLPGHGLTVALLRELLSRQDHWVEKVE